MSKVFQLKCKLQNCLMCRDNMINEICEIQEMILRLRGFRDSHMFVKIMKQRGLIRKWNRLDNRITDLRKRIEALSRKEDSV